MTRDDSQWLLALHAEFGGERFTLQQIHRRVCRSTQPAMRADQRAEYEAQLQRLEGYVEPSPGPRGGRGYCLTGRAIVHISRTRPSAIQPAVISEH